MKGLLKKSEDGSWYVEYTTTETSVFSTGEPSKFVLTEDGNTKIKEGEWFPYEGMMVDFELRSLPSYPFYEALLDSFVMRQQKAWMKGNDLLSPTTPVTPKKMKTRYKYNLYFLTTAKAIICDEMYQSSEIYYFYVYVPTDKTRIEYTNGGYSTREVNYEKELIAQLPIANTGIYKIEKFQEEEK
jgi:hypothetical protein